MSNTFYFGLFCGICGTILFFYLGNLFSRISEPEVEVEEPHVNVHVTFKN